MTTELAKTYDPSAAQDRWLQHWDAQGYSNADPQPDREQHTIMIPLPNVTGALHMGHCLNGTLQDLLTRWRRMQGHVSLWMPGTDHAGIATQAVVERRMFEEEGITRHDIGRDALVERIWKWKEEYEARILDQLKQIGASCDWRRVRFTLDDLCSRAVRRTFFKMFCDGLIYRGKRLVNWDVYLQTAVADDEVFAEEVDGHFWTFSYPVVGDSGEPTGSVIRFSTTRPETMLGDTAVCVHPADERYTGLVGKKVRIPLNGRLIPIIADALLANRELGTGAVKVTPAHDANDYACGLRNDLEFINILNPDGTINDSGGEFSGTDRYDARTAVVSKMEELGHYDGIEERKIPVKHSDRSKTPIEPYLSNQWFVKMDQLAQSAMDAVEDSRVLIFPRRYTKTYMDWLGEKRDWCISRQLWWGHRIPVWSKVVESSRMSANGLEEFGAAVDSAGKITFPGSHVSRMAACFADGVMPGETLLLVCVDAECREIEQRLDAAGFGQDPDVLDTWFSSALWPHATLGWPDLEHDPPMIASSPLPRRGADQGEGAAEGNDAEQHPPHPASAHPRLDRDRRTLPQGGEGTRASGTNRVLDYFYPGSVLVTSRDIITLWVARMVLTGLYNMGDVPFRHVYIHPKILDGLGQTMSKSKGNGVDPLELIDKYGTDAVRFTISSLAGETQDVRLPVGYECPHCGAVTPQAKKHQEMRPMGGNTPSLKCGKCKKEFQFPSPWFTPDIGAPVARIVSERFDYGRNFCNKLWNACRFAFFNLDGFSAAPVSNADLQMEDRWVLSRLTTTARSVTEMLARYQFDQATRTIREFTWNEFCDWYLEMIKPRLRDDTARPAAQRVLVVVIDSLIRLLHPFAPFITEELWHRLNQLAPVRGLTEQRDAPESVMIADWPEWPAEWCDSALERRFKRLQEIIAAVRNVRALYKINPKERLKLFMRCAPEVAQQMQAVADQFDNLSKTMLEAAGLDVNPPRASVPIPVEDADGYIPLEGLIDLDAELERLKKKTEELRKRVAAAEKKLSNPNFVEKAPEDVVNNERSRKTSLQEQLANVEHIIDHLS